MSNRCCLIEIEILTICHCETGKGLIKQKEATKIDSPHPYEGYITLASKRTD